jgi:hypothetical protein
MQDKHTLIERKRNNVVPGTARKRHADEVTR